jgi:GntR family transcriptional repressor for pyruvate dehydrogenase complex
MTEFERLKLEPAYRKVAAALTERITAGALQPGERLPAELELARQLGVHRSTVREALRELESGGLLRRERGSKLMMVSRPDSGAVASGVTRALRLHAATVGEVWETMTVLEPTIAELAARRRSAAALAELTAVVARAEEGGTGEAAAQAADFFRALAAAANNRVLAMSQEPLLQFLDSSLLRLITAVPQARARIVSAQRRILEAITAGDTAAARNWCEKHIRDYRRGFEIAGIDLAQSIARVAGKPRRET